MTDHTVTDHTVTVRADVYAEVLQFYAVQMHHLDALDIEAYAATFTEGAVLDHAHMGLQQVGRSEIVAHAKAVLPRYQGARMRHWNSNYLVKEEDRDQRYAVTYASLVSRLTDDGGPVFQAPFTVTDTLVRVGHGRRLGIERRVILQDRPGP